MVKLIDAEAFRAIMYQRCMVEDSEDQRWDSGCWIRYRLFEKTLEEMPPAQPEQKTGRWIIRDNPGTGWYRVTCSKCGEDVTSVIPVIGYPPTKAAWNYCPDCGARMEDDDD